MGLRRLIGETTRYRLLEGRIQSGLFCLPTAHHLFVMEDLEAARRRYNELYPDRQIDRVGDTQEPYYYLVLMAPTWQKGQPLADVEIAAIEAMTPPDCFS